MKRVLPFVIIAGALGAVLLTAWYLKRSAVETPRTLQPASSLPRPPGGALQLGADPPHALGDPDAPVMIEEFGDFECPPCGKLHPILKSLKAEFGPRLVIVFREYPMASLHTHALAAAKAAEAAGLQGKFWQMHDTLYANQKTWHEAPDAGPIFEEYAAKIGLNVDQYKRDVNSEAVEKRITLDRQRASWIGVNGTPTVFLNGREVPADRLTLEKLRLLIDTQ